MKPLAHYWQAHRIKIFSIGLLLLFGSLFWWQQHHHLHRPTIHTVLTTQRIARVEKVLPPPAATNAKKKLTDVG